MSNAPSRSTLLRSSVLAATLVAICTASVDAQSRDLNRLLNEVTADVEANRKLTQVMVDKIFSFAELGFHEVETSRYLVRLLRENGFEVVEGISGSEALEMLRMEAQE